MMRRRMRLPGRRRSLGESGARGGFRAVGAVLSGGPDGRDVGEAGEEADAGAGHEGGEGGAEGGVAGVEAGEVGCVGGIEPAATAKEPEACRPVIAFFT